VDADGVLSVPSAAPTPNFDAVLAHIASSSSNASGNAAGSPLVRADRGFPGAPNGSRAGVQRLRGFDLLSNERARGLSRAWTVLEAAQRRYYRAALLHSQVGESLTQLSAQFPAARTSVAPDAHTALVADTQCLWQLAQAEAFLRLDGEDAPPASSTPAAAVAGKSVAASTSASTETTLFGLDWTSLSGAFRPSSFDQSEFSSAAVRGLLLPEVETALRERAEELWNDFDPSAEERSQAEREQQQMQQHQLQQQQDGPNSAASILAEEIAAHTKDSSHSGSSSGGGDMSLAALVRSRLAHAHAHEAALQRTEMLRARTDAHRHTIQAQALALSAHLLADVHLGLSSAEQSGEGGSNAGTASASGSSLLGLAQCQAVSRSFLQQKLAVLAAKIEKVAAEVQRDTYLGLASDVSGSGSASGSSSHGSLILPSLRVVSSTLSSLSESRVREAAEKQRQLERVRALGPALQALAEDMDALNKQIEHKKWSLQQLYAQQQQRPPRRSR
jgi:hypothetical protein